jgi:hypothetical protein
MAITVVAVIALLSGTAGQDDGTSRAQRTGERVVQGLEHPFDAIASIEVARANGRFVLQRSESSWSNLGVGGFPALPPRIESTIAGLAGLTFFAPKTRRTRLHHELGVEDVSPASRSTRLTLKDVGGAVLADIIVGKPKLNIAGLGREGVYVRLPSEQRAWLAEGRLDVHHDAPGWSNRLLVDIEPTAVQALRLQHADGEVIAFTRASGAGEPFALEGLPDGTALEQPAQLNYLAGIMTGLRFDDAAHHQATSARKLPVRVMVQSANGLTVTLDATPVDAEGRVWGSFKAGITTAADSASSARTEAKRINTELAGWVFRLPRAVAQRLSVRRAELLGVSP